MICQVCEAELDDGASVCEACGAIVGTKTSKTVISFGESRDTVGGPARGNVLAERYEVVARVSADVVTSRYRAVDQETEHSVLVTVLNPDLFQSNRERDDYLARLEPEIGRGGAYLPALLDADRDGHFVFAVEPFVPGPSLREILDARRARGEAMEPGEVLPVVAQLQAALASVNGTLPHGDVRAEKVVVSKEGVRLTGAFILAALPKEVFGTALSRNGAWRAVLAPEVIRAGTSTSSDRYGAAAIIFEALTRKPPSGVLPVLGGSLARVGEEVRALLALEPSERPLSLHALADAIAIAVGVSVPRFDPASFKRPRVAKRPRSIPATRYDSNAPNVDGSKFDNEITEERLALSSALAAAPNETEPAFPLHDPATVPEPSRFDSQPPDKDGSDTARYPVLRDSQPPASGLKRSDSIPSSVGGAVHKHLRDMLNAPMNTVPSGSASGSLDDEFDPRLVRAALGVTLDDATMNTIEDHLDPDETRPLPSIQDDFIDEPRPFIARTPIPPRLRKSAMPQTAAERSMIPQAPRTPSVPRSSPLPPRRNSVPAPPVRIPQTALQAYPRVDADSGPPPTGAITTRDAEPTDLVRHEDHSRMTMPPDPNSMTMKPHARSGTGIWILGAVLLGVIIVASAILYRKHRDKEIHEQLLHERFQNTIDSER